MSPPISSPIRCGLFTPLPCERSHSWRRRIISLYEDLHAAGVIHGDVDWRHILGHDWARTPAQNSDEITAVDPASIRLIDFGRSRTRYAFRTPTDQRQYPSQSMPGPEALRSVDHEPPESSSTDLRPDQLINDAKWDQDVPFGK